MEKNTRRAKLALFGIALAIPIALMLLFEIGTRIFRPHVDPMTVFLASPQLRVDTQGETTKGMFEFDPVRTWRLRSDLRKFWWDYTVVTTNSRGIRMMRDVGEKAPGAVRVVTLGDSVTFGYRVPVVFPADSGKEADPDPASKTYPWLLEEHFKNEPGAAVDVLPLACPGYTSAQGLAWFRAELEWLKPDVVTACFGWNNIRAAGLPDRATFPQTSGQRFARQLICRSQALLHLAKDAGARKERAFSDQQQQPEPRTSPDEYIAPFLEMAALCKKQGAWFGIILPVYRDHNTPETDPKHPDSIKPDEAIRMVEYRGKLREAAKANGIPVMEIPELMEDAWPGNTGLFGERIHPNPEGHKLMAERVREFIAAEVARRRAGRGQ